MGGDGGAPMDGIRRFLDGLRTRASERRKRALHRAAAEMQRRDPHEGSIWRSGKGGAHHDR